MLRAATAAEHQRVDAIFSRFDLGTAEGYRAFLLAQAAAFLPVERALDVAGAGAVLEDWPTRQRGHLLASDLEGLGIAPPPPLRAPDFGNPDRLLGAIYVLEGSRLGGAVLKRTLPASMPQAFLNAKGEPGAWRKLLETLDNNLYGRERIDSAVSSAKEVFRLFEAAAQNSGACAA